MKAKKDSIVRKQLWSLGACSEAIRWAEQFPTLIGAWEKCERGDWLLWLAAKLGLRKLAVRASCECVRPALAFAKTDVPKTTIEVVLRWCDGTATIEEVIAARRAAYAAAAAYAADVAAYAAAAAAYAAAYAADVAAAYAAAYAADAAAYAAGREARTRSLLESANTVRRIISPDVVESAISALNL